MINTEITQVTYLTRADQTTRYSIPFVYNKNELTDAPELTVTLNGSELVFGTDYTVNESGLQLVSAAEEGLELVITRTSVFEQLRDFQTGLIDPEQIEGGFDDSVMRDQELKRGLSDLSDALDEKQDIIPDLDTIRSGAAAGATALQPTDLATVATTGSYNDLLDRPIIPSVGAGVITITQGGVIKGSFGVNQSGDATIEIDEGGGAVDSVNGKVGVVVLDSSDVGALPNTTKYAASIALSIDPATFIVTAQLKDQDNNNIGLTQTIDLPLESVVVSGAYDSATKEVVLTLEGGSTIRFSVADLVSGLQTEITSVNMLSADLVDDSNSAHKFVTAADKTTWSGKQDYISDLGTIRSGASAGATAVQPGDLATVATSGSYSDLTDKPTIPTVGAGTITITQGGTTKGSFSVNQSTDATIDIDVGGGSFVPQYETLPQSTPERIGEIAQYVGEYTGSYSAVGSASLGTISVDNDKFASVIRGDGGKTHVFRYDNTGAVAYWNQGEYSWNISSTLAAWDALCVALIGSTSDGTGLAYNGDNNWTLNWSVPVTTSQLESYGLVITGTPNAGESVFVGVARNGGWYRDGSSASYPTVDISDTYGISYTGTPGNGDSITVTTLWEYITGYFYECVSGLWQQINTQPVPQQTTITIITED